MTLSAVYEGNTTTDYTAAESWFGQNFDGVTAFTGQNGWADYDGSVGWEIGLWKGVASQVFWSIPLIANGSDLHDAGLGAYNSHYLAAAKQLAATGGSGPIYIRTGWEFNGNWEVWSAQSNPADYVAAFQQFVDTYRSVSNRFVFVWTPQIGAANMTDPTAAYPGDKYVDIIGEDFYYNKAWNTQGAAATFNYFVTQQYGLQWQQDFAAAHGKTTATPEWGTDASDSADFVKLATAWFASHHEVYQSYWDSNASFDGKLSNNSAMAAAGAALKTDVGALMTANATGSQTSAIAAINAAAPVAPTMATATAILTHHVSSDFDGDGKSDVLVVNNATGDAGVWETSHGTGGTSFVDLAHFSKGYVIAATGDFDGDGITDVVLHNAATGDVGLWESGGQANHVKWVDLGVAPTGYQIVGTGDFDGDGKADVFMFNAATGVGGAWESSKGTGAASFVTIGHATAGWSVAGIGDFNGDGKADVLLFNASSGAAGAWEASTGSATVSWVAIGNASSGWSIAGIGDFNGDGKDDILWRSSNWGTGIWESTPGQTGVHWVNLDSVSTDQHVVSVGDFDGDGKADILWQNNSTGQMSVWESSHGLSLATAVQLGNIQSGFSVATHGDYAI